MSPAAKLTPLHQRHLSLGATLVDFAGYAMPLQYSSIRQEHLAVRQHVGVFDVSHMGEVAVTGAESAEFVQRLLTNDISRIPAGMAQYNLMCNNSGGIVDDVIAYREDHGFMIVVNAACRDKDFAWMRDNAPAAITLRDDSETTALIAVQGPESQRLLGPLCRPEIGDLPPFHWLTASCAGVTARISRTGYTGEDGFELYVDAAAAPAVWDALFSVTHMPLPQACGLGARDTLRLEAGLRLYGQDMDESTDPYSCGLGWTVKLAKGDFIGAAALRPLQASPPYRFLGLQPQGRAIARHGEVIYCGSEPAGTITSGTFGFSVNHPIATGSLPREVGTDAALHVQIRGQAVALQRVPLPFYRRA